MLKLIADSGSTKTQWLLCGDCGRRIIATGGLNPVHMSDEQIAAVLENELFPEISAAEMGDIGEVAFYGAGVRDVWKERMQGVLRSAFPQARTVSAESDMLGAARALLGEGRGIACILGTGSNSCYYDGQHIVKSVPPLGYILGDEGSGARLGRRLVADVMKGVMSEDVCNLFWKETGETSESVIRKIYREPLPARYLASFATFLARHIEIPEIRELVIDEFRLFFERNIKLYDVDIKEINFVGSIAYYFSSELGVAARQEGYEIGTIIKNPIDRL